MLRYLLDSGAASDFINRRSQVPGRAADAVLRGDRLGTCIPVVGELFAGVEWSKSRERNHARLVRTLRKLTIWPYDRAAAEEYGRIFAFLRKSGRPMQQIDIQIAAIARTLGDCIVISADGDLRAIPGLKVEDWSTKSES